MEPYTLDRNFVKQDLIDGFHSIIWTEKYYGDSDVELVVPITEDMIEKLPIGRFLGVDGSDEVMILETVTIEEGKLKFTGISLLPWMNNRFVRTSGDHAQKVWTITDQKPGQMLWTILYNMCVEGSPYLNGTINTNIPNPQRLAIPRLKLKSYDTSLLPVTYNVPYKPVYEAMKELATAVNIGMKLTLEENDLLFQSYKGLDRTSGQTILPVVRFSPHMDSLTDIKELQSIAALKTDVYIFAPASENPVPTTPGVASRGAQYIGFDLRAMMILSDDLVVEPGSGASELLQNLLTARANLELLNNGFVVAVDGEIVPTSQFKYGVHYNLGDLIEVQGNTGVVQTARVTEYIRSQDAAGERAYPTVSVKE